MFAWTFSSCGSRGPLPSSDRGPLPSCGVPASLCGGLSCCGAQAPGGRASEVVVPGLSCPVAHGIFLDQGGTGVPCIARWILIHWTTREALGNVLIALYGGTHLIFAITQEATFIAFCFHFASQVVLAVENLPADKGDAGWNPGSGRSLGEGNESPRCSCLGNPLDRGAWWAAVHRVTESQT